MVAQRQLEYTDASGEVFEGVLCYPDGADSAAHQLPTVLIFHAFGGCAKFEVEKAKELAKLGYVALAADVYGKGKRGTNREENYALMSPLVQDRPKLLKQRLFATLEAVHSLSFVDKKKVAAIGYCFGGLCALDLARHGADVLGVVSFHGTLTLLPGSELTKFPASVAVHHGDADPHIKEEQVLNFLKEMRERDVDFHFVSHGAAEHAFTEPHASSLGVPGVSYNAKADKRSWASMCNFLQELFGQQ